MLLSGSIINMTNQPWINLKDLKECRLCVWIKKAPPKSHVKKRQKTFSHFALLS